MPLPPEIESTSVAGAAMPSAEGTAGLSAWFRGGRVVWLIAVAAVPQSLVAAKLLNGVVHPEGMLPGIAFLFMLVLGVGWLVLAWGLVALAVLVRRKTLRLVVLALLVLPDLWCLPILVADSWVRVTYREPDIETGVGYFDHKADRDLVVAVRACNPRMRQYGLVCDLDKVAALARATDVYEPGMAGASQMALALRNGPNPDVLRTLLRAGKAPDDIVRAVFYDAIDTRDVPLLRATLDAGLDPNGLADSVNPVLFMAEFHGWEEGVATLLDAGATIDQTDSAGFTVLMRAIEEGHYGVAALLLARGAAEDRVAQYGKSMETLVAKIPHEDREKLAPAVLALMDRHRPR
jgi:Ankyrin repeats (many copies)